MASSGRTTNDAGRSLPGWVRPEDLPVPLHPPEPDDEELTRRRWPVVVGLVVAVAVFASGVLWLARSDGGGGDSLRATPGTTVASTVRSSVVTATALTSTTAATTTVPTTAPGPALTITTADASKPVAARELVVDGSKVALRGAVGDRGGAEAVVAKVAGALGAANVAADLVVDPRAQPTIVPVRAPGVSTYVGATSDYTPEFGALLDTVAKLAAPFPAMEITVYGYTDDQGTASENQATARRRADAVAQALVERGVARSQLRVVPKGPADPVASNATQEGRLRNRRVELALTGLY